MSEERKQVLEMLAEGKISADEAERLLSKMEILFGGANARGFEKPDSGTRAGQSEPTAAKIVKTIDLGDGGGKRKALKYLRVLVDSSDGDVVNVRVPLALVRTGIKLSAVLPSEANERLSKKGVDLSQLNDLTGDDLIEALRELNIDVDSANGDKVRIFCE